MGERRSCFSVAHLISELWTALHRLYSSFWITFSAQTQYVCRESYVSIHTDCCINHNCLTWTTLWLLQPHFTKKLTLDNKTLWTAVQTLNLEMIFKDFKSICLLISYLSHPLLFSPCCSVLFHIISCYEYNWQELSAPASFTVQSLGHLPTHNTHRSASDKRLSLTAAKCRQHSTTWAMR